MLGGGGRAEFPGVAFLHLEEVEVELREGVFHSGLARVVRGFGVKHYSTVTSVLLFCALPPSVSFVATGFVSP